MNVLSHWNEDFTGFFDKPEESKNMAKFESKFNMKESVYRKLDIKNYFGGATNNIEGFVVYGINFSEGKIFYNLIGCTHISP